MAQTEKSLSTLTNTTLANNTTGDITPESIRDMLVSLRAARGGLHITSSAATTVTAGTPIKALGTTALSGNEVDVDDGGAGANNRLRFDPDETIESGFTRFFLFTATLSVTTSVSNVVVKAYFAKNDTIVVATEVDRKVGTGSDVGAMPLTGHISLGSGDYVEVFIDTDTNCDVTLDHLNVDCIGFLE